MRILRAVLAFLLGVLLAVPLLVLADPSNTTIQPIAKSSPVYTGVGAPRSYPDTVDNGGEILTDGTDPVLVPWGGVLQVTCDALAATERVLVCFSMHIDGVPDVSDGHLSDGTRDAEGHCMYLTSVSPTDDMRLDASRFLMNERPYPGAQITGAVGACNRSGTAYHLAPCTVAGEGTDCGAASTCDVGMFGSTQRRAIDMIAGAWVISDSSAASEDCVFRVDI